MKPKVLWLAHRDPLNPKAGGAERTIFEVCTRLVTYGYDITLVTAGWKGCSIRSSINGIKVIRLGNSITFHLLIPLFLIFNNFDVVVNDLGHAIPWPSTFIFKENNIIFFHHLHARSLPGQVNRLLAVIITAIEKTYQIIYHNNTFVTESSTSVADLVHLGIDQTRIVRIPPGVNTHLFHPNKKTDFPSIVYFGGMRKYKRPEECIYLLNDLKVKVEKIMLNIIGTGPELPKMRKIVKELGLDTIVNFLGRLGNEELSEVVASSWVNIHSSITEGWGFSILEASAAGTPTVAYDVPGVVDAIDNGINGIKVKDGDRRALVAATLEILHNPEKWWSSSVKVAERYSWEKTVEEWIKLLGTVIKE
ncbi:MAG: glycosyltransferase family 4 protein [Candidatus Parvarchaeota archaeon]